MSSIGSDTQLDDATQEAYAVGLIAADDIGVLDNVLRATAYDLPVILADTGESDSMIEIAHRLDIRVIGLSNSVDSAGEVRNQFATAASTIGAAGVIIPADSTTPIDIERSIAEFDADKYVSDAVSQKAGNELSVLAAIPAYNEEMTIANVVQEAKQYTDLVLVIDDDSNDDTAQRAEEAGATVIRHEENSGYGAALQTAFQEARERRVDHLVILDGDGQHDPNDIPKTIRVQKKNSSDIVIGSRFAEGAETNLPIYRRFGLAVVNILTNISMGIVHPESRVGDTQSGFRAYSREAIESLSEDEAIGSGMSASTDILYHAHKHGYDIEEIGTTVDYDVEHPSTHNSLSHGVSLVGNILRTVERERPITILGVPGFLFSFIGIILGYGTFSNYISTGSFPLGLALISATFVLGGVFACFTAIILHALNQQF
ncbi:glycosyltransferase family 2 protein [Halorubrum ezzemoulense]|uniref:glycosyltransferase family 2 protein n=1 Tax=Halorubrum ezzemoulense TaxID=337243 RepID=UPI00232EB51F|nr:glycosyltransferase family 2 protein [Halorubrum ezzemoulense]MDB9235525.1 glycosyltransferase family 2 protein [Halorubrum ezzemoulense]